jgi:hypothetical protein
MKKNYKILNFKLFKNKENLINKNFKINRDFDDIFNENYFPKLKQLNLSKNLFQNLKIFGEMKKLEILIMSSNKIDTLMINSNVD